MNVHDSMECDCGEDLVPLFMPFSGEINYICEIFARNSSCGSSLPSFRSALIMFAEPRSDEQSAPYLDPTF